MRHRFGGRDRHEGFHEDAEHGHRRHGRHHRGEEHASGFGRGEHGFGRGRGRRGGRLFGHGELRFLILHLIAERPRHGYEVIKDIEETLGGAYSPSQGVVYPTLTLLQEMGLATVTAPDGPRKLYEITDAGRAYLEENKTIVDEVLARLKAASAAERPGPAPQLVRAMENLRLALQLRQSRGPLTPEQVRAIAAALDAAAVAIEDVK